MRSRFLSLFAVSAALVGIFIGLVHTTAKEPTATVTASSAPPQLKEPPTNADEESEPDLRYEFVSHTFSVNDVEQEIWLKLDSYTGKVWRFHASARRWDLIPEPKDSKHHLEASHYSRYELHTHDYYDVDGEDQELVLRVDRVSGLAWTYRGASGTWKDVEQN